MENTLLYVLDLCGEMSIRELECVIANLEILKENKIEEENEEENYNENK